MRRWAVVLIVPCALIALFLFSTFRANREPQYQGRTLTSWLRQASTNFNVSDSQSSLEAPETKDAVEAVRHIGTNAVPFLLDWLQHPVPAWKQSAHDIATLLPRRIEQSLVREQAGLNRGNLAGLGFYLLGNDASPAMPELVRLMREPSTPQSTREAAMTILAQQGVPGLTALLMALQDPQQPTRRLTLFYIGSMRYLGTNAAPAIPVLIHSLQDTNEDIVSRATGTLGLLSIEPETSIPALTNCLKDPRPVVRRNAAEALGKFREQGHAAIPALSNALADANPTVRLAATNSLKRITSESPR